jgi:hypothetical protein
MNNWNLKDKRVIAYDAIYGSDIFNQLPPKKVEKVYNYYDNIYNDFNNYHNLQQRKENNKYINKKQFKKNPSSPNFKTTYNQSFIYNNNMNLEKNNKENEKIQINNISQKEINNCRKRNIDSLKSNIFNDKIKEKQNKKFNSNKTINNIWNTNLDWRNAKSELVFYNKNNNYNKNKIEDLKKEKIKNFYKNKNIMNHQFKINDSKNIDMIQIKKDLENEGIHLFNMEYKSNFLNGHKDQSVTFKIRENSPNEFRKKLDNYINNEELNLLNIQNYKDINPKKYYQGNQKNCKYKKESKIKE